MEVKKIFSKIAIFTITMFTVLSIAISSNAANETNLFLGLEEYRSSNLAYMTEERIMWKITSYDDLSGSNPDKTRTIYCIKAGPGFGSSSEMGNGTVINRNYTVSFNLKDYESIESIYKAVLPSNVTDENNTDTVNYYNSLVWVLEHCYVPAKKSSQTALAAKYRNELLTAAGIPNSTISDDEIDIAQQLAIWYFTNNDEYKITEETFSLWVKSISDTEYQSLGDKFADGDYRNDDAIALFIYLVENGRAAGNIAPVNNETPVTIEMVADQTTTVSKDGNGNYIVGPYSLETDALEYKLNGTLKDATGNTNLTYSLLDASKQPTTLTLRDFELAETQFYLSIPDNQNVDGARFTVSMSNYETTLTYWSVAGANPIDQPVVEIERTENNPSTYIDIDIPEYKFDLSLRKYILQINGKDVQVRRIPEISSETIANLASGNTQTVTKEHTKTPLAVEKGDTVLYEIRIYNEGDVDGYAKQITDYLPSGLTLKENSTLNTNNGWTNPSGDGKTIVTTKLANTLLSAFNGTNISSAAVQVECVVTAEVTNENSISLKNVAEITADSDKNGNEIDDVDSVPNNLTDTQKQNYNPGESEKGWGYEDDDDYEQLVLPGKYFDLALRKFIVKINDEDVDTRVPVISSSTISDLNANKTYTVTKEHTKTPLTVETGDTVLYTIRIYNEGELAGYAKEITDYLPTGLTLKKDSTINTENGWTNPSGDGKTIVTTKLSNRLLAAFNGTTIDYADVQVECVVTASITDKNISLKNIAEITADSDKDGNEIDDVDSTPKDLTDEQKQNYNPGESEKGWGYEDDDDYEELIVPGKVFDLALRKFITSVNGKELIDSTTGKYLREPTIGVTNLVNNINVTTADYKHQKDPVGVRIGDIVIYTLRIYNEGDLDGYASSVTDYLPPYLEFVTDDEEQFNASYGWLIGSDFRTATTTKLAKTTIDPEENLIKAFDSSTMTEPDYVELKIKCRVKSTAKLYDVITNIAEITGFTDANGNEIADIDSKKDNTTLPTDENLPDYKGNTSNKSILTDKTYHYKGQEDDDDFEKLIIEEFDLALRKFITGVNEEKVTNRIPVFTKNIDANGNYIYEHTKEPIEVETTDIVEYTIRIYNEGNIAGYAKEIKDDIPSGLEFLPENDTNIEYRWKMLDKDGNETTDINQAEYITTDYLSKEQEETSGENLLKGFNQDTMVKPEYKDVKVSFKVIAPSSYEGIITNIAQISDDSDENGNEIEDRDSTPDNDKKEEDDIDVEHIKLTYFDLALRKFITAVNSTDITNRYPVFKIDGEGNYVYEHTKEPVEVENGNIVTYTLRIYNEGKKAGYAKEVKDDLPEGLEFLPENTINKEYRWVMIDSDGNKTDALEEAVSIKTDYLSKEQEDETGRDNLLKAFDVEKMEEPDYRDIKIAFKVTEPNTSDRILINEAQISDDSDENGDEVIDKDSTPDKWIDEEDDQDIEKVKVRYFDLALRKWVTQAIVIQDGKETVTDTGHKAEDDPEEVVKVEIVESKLNKVVVKFRYKIRVTNEGEIAGYVDEISDYIPEGLRFVAADNPLWKEADGKVVTDQLKDTLLQPGESAEVEILLTWNNGKDNLGLKVNVAEISKDRNESNTPDIDSTPNNKKDGEDDIDDAPVILIIKTGNGIDIQYIITALGCLAVLTSGIIFIKKYVL